MIRIAVIDEQRAVKLQRRKLNAVVRSVLEGEAISRAEIGLAFVTDRKIAELNWRFLRHKGPTDVITFPLEPASERPPTFPLEPASVRPPTFPLEPASVRPPTEFGEAALSGEIVISTETARRVASRIGHATGAELSLYLIHGLLHLCGYDDRAPKDRRLMRKKEQYYLEKLAIHLSSLPGNLKSKI